MNPTSRWLAAAAVSMSFTTVALAQAPVLDVKMGLWEITSTTNLGGQIPTVDTSKMTPEQKAQMEAVMKAMTGTHSAKTCITREKFNKSNFMTNDESGKTCKQTVATNTRTSLDATVVCTGERARTEQMHIEALSSTSVEASIKLSSAEQGRPMTASVTMTGKWLGADCGNLK
jgi:hypothetical protein